MGISSIQSFLATVANNYTTRHLSMVRDLELSRTPDYYKAPKTKPSGPTGYVPPEKIDKYEPSTPVRSKSKKESPAGDKLPEKNTGTTSTDTPSTDSPVQKNPDGTYYYQRQAELEYKLDLRFDLGAIMQTVEQLAEGDTSAVEQIAAAGFGLTSDFRLDGTQQIDTNMVEGDTNSQRSEKTSADAISTGAMAYRSRNFAMDSFYKEALKVRRSLDESVQDSHRRTTNRIALRYQVDNKFSMAFADRFNIQTKQVAEQAPDAAKAYVDSTGELAAKGSSDLMATFFDAVDSYLNGAETKLTQNVASFFDKAAAELGFSGELVDAAREHLTGTIGQFFDRVQTALASVEAKFLTVTTDPVTGAQPATTPTPATAQDNYTLATV
jgi:hypothetical protein